MIHLHLFRTFAKIGVLGFGGGPSMIPLLQAECVRAGWLTDEQFVEALAAANALPGPLSTKMAVYVGAGQAGWTGAVAAVLGVVGPSALAMGLLGALLVRHRGHPVVQGALAGARPAVAGLLAFVAWDLASSGVRGAAGILLAVGAFTALSLRVHPGWVLLASVIVGVVALRP